ncbi:MAG: hypothetical protein VW874_06295, partial [Gammaproteobacteria bacterium]
AQQRAEQGRQSLVCHATGFETDKRTLRAAQANIGRLELEGHINIIAGSFSSGRENYHNALIISNPPYGERLGDLDSLIPTYKAINSITVRLPVSFIVLS